MHDPAAAGPRMVEQEMALVQGAIRYRWVAMLTSWTIGLSITHIDSDLRETHTGPVSRGRLSSVTGWQPSSEGTAAKHYLDLRPRLTRVGGWSDPKQDEVQRRLAQLLVLAAASSAAAAAGDCFGATWCEGEAGAR
jgi:hypothetical protein